MGIEKNTVYDDIVVAETLNLKKFFSDFGSFEVPLYQRPYKWDAQNIDHLLEDLSTLLDPNSEQIRFLGAIILSNKKDSHFEVIDGQQRLTTLTLLTLALFEGLQGQRMSVEDEWQKKQDDNQQRIEDLEKKFDSEKDIEKKLNLSEEIRKLEKGPPKSSITASKQSQYSNFLDILKTMLLQSDISTGDDFDSVSVKRIIPSLIQQGREISPLYKMVQRAVVSYYYTTKRNSLNESEYDQLLEHSLSEEAFIDSKEYENKGHISKKLFGHDSGLLDLNSESWKEQIKSLLERTFFTVVRVKKEDFALDIFESLNSTGEPLTSLETFYPLAINSDIKDHLFEFKALIDGFGKIDTKKSASVSSQLVILHANYYGVKLGSHLSDQRRHLRDTFKKMESYEQKLLFIGRFVELNKIIEDATLLSSGEPLLDDFSKLNNLGYTDFEKLSYAIFASSGTKLAFPILEVIRRSEANNKDREKYTKALLSFFILYRAYSGGTDGIDNYFREIIKFISKSKLNLVRFNVKLVQLFDKKLKLQTSSGSINRDPVERYNAWKANAEKSQIGDKAIKIAKAMLLFAYQNLKSLDDNGNVDPKKYNGLRFNQYEAFFNKVYLELEHIAPQNMKQGEWDSDILASDRIHVIGNLTLLAKIPNISASNYKPEVKSKIYKAISANSKSEIPTDFEFKDSLEKYLKTSTGNELIGELSDGILNWNVKSINQRSDILLQAIWSELTNEFVKN